MGRAPDPGFGIAGGFEFPCEEIAEPDEKGDKTDAPTGAVIDGEIANQTETETAPHQTATEIGFRLRRALLKNFRRQRLAFLGHEPHRVVHHASPAKARPDDDADDGDDHDKKAGRDEDGNQLAFAKRAVIRVLQASQLEFIELFGSQLGLFLRGQTAAFLRSYFDREGVLFWMF